ncbi:hypothetical protein NLC29_04015, partial [Candidatus Aminicenantes bacterium AH-873-B07]|nr:hypothetical protein [Candidatus Aminicenantes bacterium AH-873-B07]
VIPILLFCGFILCQTMPEPVNVSNSAGASKWGQVAFGPDGIVHIVWEEDYHDKPGSDIFYVYYDGEQFSEPYNLTDTPNIECERPYICTSPKGQIIVVWNQGDGEKIGLREYDPQQKKWLPIEYISKNLGGEEAAVGADKDGNIYVIWFSEGRAYSRSKIDGKWEDIFRMSSVRRSTQVGIAVGKNGRVWAIWREKQANGEYKIYYRKRTKKSKWSKAKEMNFGGASQSRPHIAIGPDNVPVVVYSDVDVGYEREIWLCTIDEKENPRELVIGAALQHYPRLAIDIEGNKHIVWQIGPGDYGKGIRYINNIGGTWNEPQLMPYSGGSPRVPGISADAFGNVAIVWESSIPGRDKEIWFSSLYPVTPKKFLPPINLNVSISINSLKKDIEVTYNLSWEPNPENDDDFIKGYNIYKREDSGEFKLFVKLSKNTYSVSFTFTNLQNKIQFGISTVSLSGAESEIVVFGSEE